MRNMIKRELEDHKETIEKTIIGIVDEIEQVSELMVKAFKNNKKILLLGNGGSAADAQHIAAELTGRYKTNREALPAIAITTDTSAITAIGNDFGYEHIFDRQIEALAHKEDVVIGISTSGNSTNVILALNLAQKMGCHTVGLSGNDGGEMNASCDVNIVIPSDNTPRIQEMHILVGHILCQAIDDAF